MKFIILTTAAVASVHAFNQAKTCKEVNKALNDFEAAKMDTATPPASTDTNTLKNSDDHIVS